MKTSRIGYPARMFEEGVHLLAAEGEVPQFVEDKQVVATQAVEHTACGPVGQGCVKVVEEILHIVKKPTVSPNERFPEKPGGEAGFAGSGFTDEYDVLPPLDKGAYPI